MTYRKNNIWNRPLPRFFGVFVLLFSLGTIFWLSRNVVFFQSKAAVGNAPKDIQISNITHDSFTISYITDEEVAGSVSYGKDENVAEVAFDKRDGASPSPHRIHYITISNIAPETKYFFAIASGDEIFKNDEKPYEITTAPIKQAGNSTQDTISGRVFFEDINAPSEAVAYLKSNSSQLISTLILPDGSYSLSLKDLLKKDLSGLVSLSEDTPFELIIAGSTLRSKIKFLPFQTNPLPPVVLSKDYDFTLGNEPLATSEASESAQITGFPISEGAETLPSAPRIITPKTDEKLKDQQPLFKGVAVAGSDIEILIESTHEVIATVQADENGNWEYRPENPLEPGEHTITIKALDAQGILQTIKRSFTVFAQGSQFTEPSVAPTSTPTPTAAPTTQPTIAPTATPTLGPTVTVSPTPTPSPTAIMIVPTTSVTVPMLSPTSQITVPPIPPSGSTSLIFGLTGLSILIGIGSLLFFLL